MIELVPEALDAAALLVAAVVPTVPAVLHVFSPRIVWGKMRAGA